MGSHGRHGKLWKCSIEYCIPFTYFTPRSEDFYICSYSWWAGPTYVVAQLHMSMCPIMLLKRSPERALICLDSLHINNRDYSYSRQQKWNIYRNYYLLKRSCREPAVTERYFYLLYFFCILFIVICNT